MRQGVVKQTENGTCGQLLPLRSQGQQGENSSYLAGAVVMGEEP